MIFVAPPIERDVLRLRDEFLALPGLSLTPAQVARMLSIRESQAAALLASLEEDGFLVLMRSGGYRRSPASCSVR